MKLFLTGLLCVFRDQTSKKAFKMIQKKLMSFGNPRQKNFKKN